MRLFVNHYVPQLGFAPVGSLPNTSKPRLPANEVRRRMFHMLPGLLPFLLAGLPRAQVEQNLWFYQLVIVISAASLTALAFCVYPVIARDGEQHCAINAVTYAAVSLLMLLAFPRQPQFAAVSLVILAFGDGSATLFGILWGRQKLPWNQRKSWVGVTAFLVCAGPSAAFAFWLHSDPPVSIAVAACCGVIPALICAGVESLSSDCCENLRISGTAAVVVLICSALFVNSNVLAARETHVAANRQTLLARMSISESTATKNSIDKPNREHT